MNSNGYAAGDREPSPPGAIGVWGHFHGGNLGDDLVVAVLIAAIRRRRRGARIVAVSMAPSDTQVRHSVQALPINPGQDIGGNISTSSHELRNRSRLLRRIAQNVPGARPALQLWRELHFALRSYAALRSVDQLVVAGSGQLQDVWGPWTHPYTTFRWALLSRLAGVETALPSIGVGPVTSPLSGRLIRKSVEWAKFVSVRDEDSARVLRGLGVRRELPVCPDMGWAYAGPRSRVDSFGDAAAIVGVNVMPHEDPRYWPSGQQSLYEAYRTKMAALVANLLRQGDRVVLFSSQTRSDRLVAEDLSRDLGDRGLADHPLLEWEVDRIETAEQLVAVVSRCDYVVAARFHSVLVPLSLGIPTIALAYQRKTLELLSQVGAAARCFDIASFEVGEIEAALDELRSLDGPVERADLLDRAGRFRAAVEEQFDLLFPSRT